MPNINCRTHQKEKKLNEHCRTHLLELVVERQHTSTGNTTKNVGAGTLEEGLDTFLGDNLKKGAVSGRNTGKENVLLEIQRRTWTCS